MPTSILVLIIHLLTLTAVSIGNQDPLPAVWPTYRAYPSDYDSPGAVFLGRDGDSGCICREVPQKWTVCFGRETCKKFPKHVVPKTSALKVKNTLISSVRKGDLDEVSHLTSLEIEANFYLKAIEDGCFRNMSNVRNLSISYNSNLQVLSSDALRGLVNLRQLFLVKNGFTDVKDVTIALNPNALPNLLRLSLSENSFVEINKTDFFPMQGSKLVDLNLALCQIEYVNPQCLAPLKKLSVLRIGENSFNSMTISNMIQNTIEAEINLKVLNLNGVGFKIGPPKLLMKAVSDSNITQLSLARNQFELIKETTFLPMPKLEYLDLREVLALNITAGAFKSMSGLRTLLLSGNKLPSVPEGALLEHLTYLDLSMNSGDSFYPSYFALGRNKFVKMKSLKMLNLSYNRLNTISNGTFAGLSNLRLLGLRNGTIFHIEEFSFSELTRLLVMNLENNPFAERNPLTKELFQGLEKLEVLLLGGCRISNFKADTNPFEELYSLRHLGLERNNLVTLPSDLLIPLSNLASLDLSENWLQSWQESIFINNTMLRVLTATQNKYTYFTEAMLQDFEKLNRLDLSGNPFTCECYTFKPLTLWLEQSQNSSLLGLLNSRSTFCVYPDKFGNLTIVEFYLSLTNGTIRCAIAYSPEVRAYYFIPAATLLFIAVFLGSFAYIYRWHIRYWMFLARINMAQYKKCTPKQSYINYQYDAFVSYSCEDRNFVVRLVSMLENYDPFLKLCVFERDFQIGSIISEDVLESIAKSRKTLLIISDSYTRSQWCRWEVQIVQNHRLFFEKGEDVGDSLVMVKLGEVADEHLTPTLKYLMKTRVYLEWDSETKRQREFWEKLRNALAAPKAVFDSYV